MSEPEQGHPTYGPPPAAAYEQPSGPPAPPGAAPVGPHPYPPVAPAYPPVAAYPPAEASAYPAAAAPAFPSPYPPVTPAYPPQAPALPPQVPAAAPVFPSPYPSVSPAYPAQTPEYPSASMPAYPISYDRYDAQPPGPSFAAPYARPAPLGFAEPEPSRTATLGIVALVAGILALVVAPIVAGIASYRIGLGVGREFALRPSAASFDWSVLSPVRDWVLLGEISFWAGTAFGIWAIVQGIVAIVKKRGRGVGIAAVVVAVLSPVAFGVVVNAWIVAGVAAGSSLGG